VLQELYQAAQPSVARVLCWERFDPSFVTIICFAEGSAAMPERADAAREPGIDFSPITSHSMPDFQAFLL
jgi:hypothetical protein